MTAISDTLQHAVQAFELHLYDCVKTLVPLQVERAKFLVCYIASASLKLKVVRRRFWLIHNLVNPVDDSEVNQSRQAIYLHTHALRIATVSWVTLLSSFTSFCRLELLASTILAVCAYYARDHDAREVPHNGNCELAIVLLVESNKPQSCQKMKIKCKLER